MGSAPGPRINSSSTSTVRPGNITTQAININRAAAIEVPPVALKKVLPITPLANLAKIDIGNSNAIAALSAAGGLDKAKVASSTIFKDSGDKFNQKVIDLIANLDESDKDKVENTRVFKDSVRADALADKINQKIPENILAKQTTVAIKVAQEEQAVIGIRKSANPASAYPIRSFADRLGSAFNPRTILNRVAVPLSPDILNTSTTIIRNAQFTTDSLGGISKTRPEILAIIDFNKIYNERDGLNNTGKLLIINYQMRALRKEALSKVENELRTNPESASLYENIKLENTGIIEKTRGLIQFYKNNFPYLDVIRAALDIKKIPRENYNLNVYLPLEDFFTQKMTYSRASYNVFSDTKVLGQLFFDLRSMLENHSFSLLNETDVDRVGDLDQIKYDKTYSLNQNYSFRVSNIRGKFLYQEVDFESFVNSLPSDTNDKAKLLLTFLSKELRISRGLFKPSIVSTITEFYGGQAVGNPFDNLFGSVGTDIFEKPSGINSLSSLLFIEDPSGVSVLPFEQRIVDDVQTTYVPGSKYFLDNILNLDGGKFNLRPINQYSEIFSSLTFKASSIIKELLDTKNKDNKLIPTNLFVSFVEAFIYGLNTFNANNSPSDQAIKKQVAAVAILKLCSEHKSFKFLIFQYLLLVGMGKSIAKGQTNIFKSLINEVRVLQNLVSIKTDDEDVDANILTTGLTGLYPYMVKTTNDIKVKILELIGGETSTEDTVAEITTSDFVDCLLSPSNSLFEGFFELCFLIDTQASGDFPNGSYFSALTNDPNNTKVTRNNQVCISGIILSIFEIFISFSTKFFDGRFIKDIKLKIAYSLQKNLFSYRLFKQQIPLTGYSFTPVQETASLVGITTQGSEAQSSRRIEVPFAILSTFLPQSNQRDVENYVEAAPDPILNATATARAQTSGADILRTSNAPSDPIPRLLNNGATVRQNSTELEEIKYAELRRSINQIFYKTEEEDKIIENALHIIEVIGDKLGSAVKNAVNYFSAMELNPVIASNAFTSNLGPSQLRTSQWIFDQYSNSQEPLGNFTRACTQADFKALLSMLKEPFATKNLANARTKILAVGIPNGFIEKLTDRIKRTTVATNNLFEDTQTDLVYINIYKKSAEDDDIIFYPKRFLFDLSLFPKHLENINLDNRTNFERILEKYKTSDYSSFTAADVGLSELQTQYKYNIINEEQKLELLRNHCQSQYLQYYVKYLSGISFDESSFPVDEYPVPATTELPQNSQNLIKLYIQKIINRATPEELTSTIRTIINDPSIREDIKDDLQMLSFGSTLMQPDLLRTKVLSQKKFDRVFLIPFNVDEFEINAEETARTTSGRDSVNNQRFIQTTERRIIGDNEVFYTNRESIPNALVFEDYFITIETVL